MKTKFIRRSVVFLMFQFGIELSHTFSVDKTTGNRLSLKACHQFQASLNPFVEIKMIPNRYQSVSRRNAMITAGAFVSSFLMKTSSEHVIAQAATNINVTPLVHTFLVSNEGKVKPIRENDATRYLTNAKVVYLFQGSSADSTIVNEILNLTVKRKTEQGPGVTPGKVQAMLTYPGFGIDDNQLQSISTFVDSSISKNDVVKKVRDLTEGDVLVVGPITSKGITENGKVCNWFTSFISA